MELKFDVEFMKFDKKRVLESVIYTSYYGYKVIDSFHLYAHFSGWNQNELVDFLRHYPCAIIFTENKRVEFLGHVDGHVERCYISFD
jgi:hypothetical protein